jgi:PAS domain S-box-containing protein
MPPDLAPLFLGTAYASLGLAALRLARLEGPGFGWGRLCLAGVAAALLEWYSSYASAFIGHRPNDFAGSMLALAALAGFLEYARRAAARRLHLGALAQTGAGLAIAALGVVALAFASGGIYDRLVWAQRAVGLPLAGFALLVTFPPAARAAPACRAAGLLLLLGLLASVADPAAWPLVIGTTGAAVLLRTVHVMRQRDERPVFARWAVLEFCLLAALLAGATLSAQRRGDQTMQLEERQLTGITEAAAAAFEPSTIAALHGSTEDLGTPAFEAVNRRLATIQRIARSSTSQGHASRFAYLMALRDGRVIFLADQPQDPDAPTMPGQLYDEASPALRRAFADGASFLEGPLRDRFGNWVTAFAPVRDGQGRVAAMLGIDFDAADWSAIKDRARLASIVNWTLIIIIALSLFTTLGLGVETRQLLRRSEHLFRTAADYTSTWEYWVGANGRMIYSSRAAERVTGRPASDFLAHPRRLLKIAVPSDRARLVDHLRSCSRDAPPCQFDFQILRPDGRTAWIAHSCESVYDADGHWCGRRASNRDITSRRETEQALARLERLQGACHQALRRLLGRDGAGHVQDALRAASEAAGCCFAGLVEVRADDSLALAAAWPPDDGASLLRALEPGRERALRLLSVGETFELLPRENDLLHGNLQGAHILLLPLTRRAKLIAAAAFAVPPARGAWTRGEAAALATLASGMSVALERRQTGAADLKS